jgi:hypothetical protein
VWVVHGMNIKGMKDENSIYYIRKYVSA